MKIQVFYPTNPETNPEQSQRDQDNAWLNVNDNISSKQLIAYLQRLDTEKFSDGRKRKPLPKSDESGQSIDWEILRLVKIGDRLEGSLLQDGATLIVRRVQPLEPPITAT
jgi:hypothetical protein